MVKKFVMDIEFKQSISSLIDFGTKLNIERNVCTITDMVGDIECKYNKSYINYSESYQISNLLRNKSQKINRSIIRNKHYCVDTTFPLYHNFFCYRESYMGASANKRTAKHVEINLYYVLPQLIYCFLNKDVTFNAEAFYSQYTQQEIIKMGDCMASIVLGLRAQEDLDMLVNLFSRDPVLKMKIEELQNVCKQNKGVILTSYILGEEPTCVLEDICLYTVLQEYICIMLKPLLAIFYSKVNKITSDIRLKSFSDFRLLCEISKEDLIDLVFTLKTATGEVQLKPYIFYNKDRIKMVLSSKYTYL